MVENWAKNKVVDSEIFFSARDKKRAESPRDFQALKQLGDEDARAKELFPTYSYAKPATVGEVTVNGKVLQLWNFSQLETLNPSALRLRALAIRDVVGQVDGISTAAEYRATERRRHRGGWEESTNQDEPPVGGDRRRHTNIPKETGGTTG
eukprot:Skav218249  [mRNA]  locus=scaffold2035:4246:13945:+ [translate_table: standard]